MARRIFLHPGELHFGTGNLRIETLLGSCVTVTVRHRLQPIGGMCHFLLPTQPRASAVALDKAALDARYGDEALMSLMQYLDKLCIAYSDCVASVYGGANVIRFDSKGRPTVGESNISFALERLHAFGFTVDTVDVGGAHFRYLTFDLVSGNMHVRHGDPKASKVRAPARDGVPGTQKLPSKGAR